jgi:dethiobiotin synthetase
VTALFVTATGTGAGKTQLARGLTLAARRRGRRVVAVKPIETGCDPLPADALALAAACGRPELARDAAFHRGRAALSPHAALLGGEPPVPPLDALVSRIRALGEGADDIVVEGAGGLLVPLDAHRTMADLAAALGYPVCIVAPDALGVLSHALTAVESARARALPLVMLVLSRTAGPDPSTARNRSILAERLEPLPVHVLSRCDGDDDLARAAAPLLDVLG